VHQASNCFNVLRVCDSLVRAVQGEPVGAVKDGPVHAFQGEPVGAVKDGPVHAAAWCVQSRMSQCVHSRMSQCMHSRMSQYVQSWMGQCVQSWMGQCVQSWISQCMKSWMSQWWMVADVFAAFLYMISQARCKQDNTLEPAMDGRMLRVQYRPGEHAWADAPDTRHTRQC